MPGQGGRVSYEYIPALRRDKAEAQVEMVEVSHSDITGWGREGMVLREGGSHSGAHQPVLGTGCGCAAAAVGIATGSQNELTGRWGNASRREPLRCHAVGVSGLEATR